MTLEGNNVLQPDELQQVSHLTRFLSENNVLQPDELKQVSHLTRFLSEQQT